MFGIAEFSHVMYKVGMIKRLQGCPLLKKKEKKGNRDIFWSVKECMSQLLPLETPCLLVAAVGLKQESAGPDSNFF